jgi:hypothetical protein
MLSISSLLALVGGLAVIYVALRLAKRVKNAITASKMGCKSPVRAFYADPSGVRFLLDGVRATKEQRVPDWLGTEFERLSKVHGHQVGTIRTNAALFRSVLFTTEPKNIQKLLATGFKDFELGEHRIKNFEPLLGHGIVRNVLSIPIMHI